MTETTDIQTTGTILSASAAGRDDFGLEYLRGEPIAVIRTPTPNGLFVEHTFSKAHLESMVRESPFGREPQNPITRLPLPTDISKNLDGTTRKRQEMVFALLIKSLFTLDQDNSKITPAILNHLRELSVPASVVLPSNLRDLFVEAIHECCNDPNEITYIVGEIMGMLDESEIFIEDDGHNHEYEDDDEEEEEEDDDEMDEDGEGEDDSI